MDNTSPFCFVRRMSDVLETERLKLRSLDAGDAATIVDALSDFSICRHLARVPFPYHQSDAEDFLQFVKACDHRSRFSAICEKGRDTGLIGIISYEWSEDKHNAELGYWLSQCHWGKGLMSEAAVAMVRHAFTINQHETMVACYHDDNPASGRILSKAGFERAGACNHFSKAQGKDVPVTNMRLTRQRWLETKNAGI